MPKLSIVIPVYNVEKYIRKCLDSVIYENIEDYEIIVVNDGSTDSSPAICAEYASRFPSLIKYISTENGGLGAARNNGLAIAKGEFVCFLDSDDYLCPNAVQEIMDMLQDDIDAYIFDMIPVTESGVKIGYAAGSDRQGAFTLDEYPEFLFCPPNACNKIWRRKFFEENKILFPGRLWFEDLYTIPKLYIHAKKFLYVEKTWYMYLQRNESITRSTNLKRNLDMITAVNQVIDYYKQQGLFEKYKDQLEYMVLYHEVITSTTRINLSDTKSPIQQELYKDYIRKFPRYRENAYVKAMPSKLKLLLFFIEHRMYTAFNLVMRLNNFVKGKHK